MGQAHRFDVVSGQHSADKVDNMPDKWQENDCVGLVVRLAITRKTVEGSVDLSVFVATQRHIQEDGIPLDAYSVDVPYRFLGRVFLVRMIVLYKNSWLTKE
jgi:hypothetical protein